MLHRACLGEERVLISGASGSVGSAAVQLAKRRGAHVTAIARPSKASRVKAIGADEVIEREVDPVEAVGPGAVDVVLDLVGGASWPGLLNVLRVGGRYVTAGAIAGPLVELDLRTLYLWDLTLFGCTWQDEDMFTNLVSYIERGAPVLSSFVFLDTTGGGHVALPVDEYLDRVKERAEEQGRPVSELLFEDFCQQSEIRCDRPDAEEVAPGVCPKTPDYEILIDDRTIMPR